jgi:hypothetical protein
MDIDVRSVEASSSPEEQSMSWSFGARLEGPSTMASPAMYTGNFGLCRFVPDHKLHSAEAVEHEVLRGLIKVGAFNVEA